MTQRKNESGNAIFMILLGVALLAALTFAVTQSNRGSTNQLNQERASIYASEIIEYSNVVSAAVAQLRLRGCADERLNFANTLVAGYDNVTAPANGRCDVFSPSGGGVAFQDAEDGWFDTAQSGETGFGNWYISGRSRVVEVGTTCATTDCSELLLVAPYLDRAICEEINSALGIPGIPQDQGVSVNFLTQFTGSNWNTTIIEDAGGELHGKSAGCFEGDTTPAAGTYHYYKVLIAR